MLTISQFAKRRGCSRQYIHNLLIDRRIKGAVKVKSQGVKGGWIWMIPRAAKIS
jgi:hypothetical protein